MSTAEIKTQIHQVIDTLPEKQLNDVLLLLTKIQKGNTIDNNLFDAYVNEIIANNRELLERLAQ